MYNETGSDLSADKESAQCNYRCSQLCSGGRSEWWCSSITTGATGSCRLVSCELEVAVLWRRLDHTPSVVVSATVGS